MKSLYSTLAIIVAVSIIACKKEDPAPENLSNEMVIVTSLLQSSIQNTNYRYHALISDFQGNILDKAELTSAQNVVLSTGDPDLKHFDFHLITTSTGQFNNRSVTTYHNITGDTVELGQLIPTGTASLHTKVTVNGIVESPQDYIFDSDGDGFEIYGSGLGFMYGDAHTISTDPINVYLSYGFSGEDKHRYYWGKDVAHGSQINLNHEDLEQIPVFKNVEMQSGLNVNFFSVFGKPNDGDGFIQMAQGSPGTVSQLPVYIPSNFATDIRMTINATSSTRQFISLFHDVPNQYIPPVVDYTMTNNANNNGFSLTGTGFDFYYAVYYQPTNNLSWTVYGPEESSMSFVFPNFDSATTTETGLSPAELTEPPSDFRVINFEPTVTSKHLLPRYNPLPFTRRDETKKL